MKMIILLLFSLVFFQAQAQLQQPHPSAVFEFQMLPVITHDKKEVRHLMDGPTKTLENFQVDQLDLTNEAVFEVGGDREMLLLILEGALQMESKGSDEILKERSIAWIPGNERFKIVPQKSSVSVYLISWQVENSPKGLAEANLEPKIFHYEGMDFEETSKGGRRQVMREETETLRELEMHITTLNEGEKSHDPHVHADEEIILILQGTVAEHINGTEYHLGPGSLVFLAAYDPHGIRNVGSGDCEYYAIRWITEKTGK